MDICMVIIILSLVMLGFMFYLMLSDSMGMASLDDITEKTPEEERRDEFDQMDELDQLISELDTPIDTFGDPVSGMDAVRRLDDVIDELVKIGGPRAVEPLIKAAEKRDAFTSCSAITALGELGHKRAVKTLVKALADDDEDVRDDAKKALKKLGHEVE